MAATRKPTFRKPRVVRPRALSPLHNRAGPPIEQRLWHAPFHGNISLPPPHRSRRRGDRHGMDGENLEFFVRPRGLFRVRRPLNLRSHRPGRHHSGCVVSCGQPHSDGVDYDQIVAASRDVRSVRHYRAERKAGQLLCGTRRSMTRSAARHRALPDRVRAATRRLAADDIQTKPAPGNCRSGRLRALWRRCLIPLLKPPNG